MSRSATKFSICNFRQSNFINYKVSFTFSLFNASLSFWPVLPSLNKLCLLKPQQQSESPRSLQELEPGSPADHNVRTRGEKKSKSTKLLSNFIHLRVTTMLLVHDTWLTGKDCCQSEETSPHLAVRKQAALYPEPFSSWKWAHCSGGLISQLHVFSKYTSPTVITRISPP